MSGNSIPLSYTVHTGPVIPLSQCGNEREVFVFQFQSGITSNKQTNKKKNTHTQPTKAHKWKLSATKRGLPVPQSPAIAKCSVLFFFFPPPFCPYYTLASGIMVRLRELLHSANVTEEGFELLEAAESKVAVLSGSRRARVRWLSATLDHLFPSGKEVA